MMSEEMFGEKEQRKAEKTKNADIVARLLPLKS